jgi:hypothetical protein
VDALRGAPCQGVVSCQLKTRRARRVIVVGLGSALDPVCTPLAAALARFDGYAARYATSADRVRRGGARCGSTRWTSDSCRVVWIQLHEDLLATLGVDRSHR